MVKFQEWTEIKQFHNLMVEIEKTKEIYEKEGNLYEPYSILKENNLESIKFKGKVKLHGQNVAITIEDDGVGVQTRSQLIEFSSKIGLLFKNDLEYFKNIFNVLKDELKCSKVTIYGEYAGEGVQKNVALSKVKGNIFCVFAIQIGKKNFLIQYR
jgi:hypothetical protein